MMFVLLLLLIFLARSMTSSPRTCCCCSPCSQMNFYMMGIFGIFYSTRIILAVSTPRRNRMRMALWRGDMMIWTTAKLLHHELRRKKWGVKWIVEEKDWKTFCVRKIFSTTTKLEHQQRNCLLGISVQFTLYFPLPSAPPLPIPNPLFFIPSTLQSVVNWDWGFVGNELFCELSRFDMVGMSNFRAVCFCCCWTSFSFLVLFYSLSKIDSFSNFFCFYENFCGFLKEGNEKLTGAIAPRRRHRLSARINFTQIFRIFQLSRAKREKTAEWKFHERN